MAFRFSHDYRARLLALPAMVRRGGGSPEGAAGALKGGRVEFREHRPYVAGDDVRDLDWHGYLRLGQLLVKEYARDEAPEIVVVLDRSASMAAAVKDRVARELAAALAYVGLAARCPATVMVCAEGGPVTVGTWRSHRKVDQVLAMIEGLGNADGATHVGSLRHLKTPSASGRVTFVGSDFLVDPLPAEAMVALARGTGAGCLVHVVTEDERHPALPEACTLVDPESGDRMVGPDGGALTAAYLRELASHEDAVAALARRHGLTSATVGDRLPFERTMIAMLAGRGVRS